jgi:hypothetical protein
VSPAAKAAAKAAGIDRFYATTTSWLGPFDLSNKDLRIMAGKQGCTTCN